MSLSSQTEEEFIKNRPIENSQINNNSIDMNPKDIKLSDSLIWLLLSNNPLDLGALNDRVQMSDGEFGASVVFTGNVRTASETPGLVGITLEHYPEMTESLLMNIIKRAVTRWKLNRVVVAHRIGYLTAGQPIVFVGTSSLHRKAAFESAEYIMDYLKNEATFWKKEHFAETDNPKETKEVWVEAKSSDVESLERWK